METEGSCKLSINDLVRYQQTRFPVGLFLPLAIFLCTASLVAGWPSNGLAGGVQIVLAWALLFQFRLWDDLNDVPHDRHDCPDRVLCRAKSLTLFRVALGISFVINLLLLLWLSSSMAMGIFLGLNVMLLVWYQLINKITIHPAVAYHVILIKYPVIVLLLASTVLVMDVRSLINAMVMVYFCFCVYELLHDHKLHSIPQLYILLAAEMVAFQLMAGVVLIDLWSFGFLATVQVGLSLAGAVLLWLLFNWFIDPKPIGRWSYAVFLIAFAWLLNYSFASYPSVSLNDSCLTGVLS